MDIAPDNSRILTRANGTVRCPLSLTWIISLCLLLLSLAPLLAYAETVEDLEAERRTCLAEWGRLYALYERAHDPQNIFRLQSECDNARQLKSAAFERLRPSRELDDKIRAKEQECEHLRRKVQNAQDQLIGHDITNPQNPPALTTAYAYAHSDHMSCQMSLGMLNQERQRQAAERQLFEASYKQYEAEEERCRSGLQYIQLGLPNQLRYIVEKCTDLDRRLATARANLQQQQQQQTMLQMRGPATAYEGQSITFSAELPPNISANLLNVQWTGGYIWLLDGRELPGTNSSVIFTAPAQGKHSISAQFWIRRGQSPSTQTLAQGGASFTVAAKQSDNQQNASLDCVGTTKARTPERKSCCERKYPDEYNRRFCEKMMKMDPHEAELLHKSFSR